MKRDIYHHIPTYKNWKERVLEGGIEGLSKANSDIIMRYVFDMEIGQNVGKGSKKGARSYGRLNVLRMKLISMARLFEKEGVKDISRLTGEQVHKLFDDMMKGKVKRKDGKPYSYVSDYARNFKAFWHWHQKVNRKNGVEIKDITEDLSTEDPKPKFVYITKEQMESLLPYFNEQQQILICFLFDSLTRFPTEALSLQAKDVYEKNGEIWVNIPEEVAKTYGRTFNLLYCGKALMKYIKKKELEPNDLLFTLNYDRFRVKLKNVASCVLGDQISHPKAKEKYNSLSGYDFRHSGAIHLRVLAQKTNISLDAIRQRGGWVDFDMLNYYTQFIGLTGEIKKEDLLIEEDKTRLEREIYKLKKQNVIQKDKNEKLWEMVDIATSAIRVLLETTKSDEKLKANFENELNRILPEGRKLRDM